MIAKYKLITTRKDLQRVLFTVGDDCALDFETTALRPSEGRVRLVSLCSENTRVLVDFDQIRGGFERVAGDFDQGTDWIVFNAGFELRWFQAAGVEPRVLDVEHLRRAILGGSRLSLKRMAKADLNEDISKEEQASDWGAPELTQEQLDYAFDDADVTWRLYNYWMERADPDHLRCFKLLCDLDAPVIEMEDTGVKLDQRRHAKLVENWLLIQAERLGRIRALVGEDEVANVNSDKQWSNYFGKIMPDHILRKWPKTEKSGQLEMSTKTLRMLAGMFPGTPLEQAFDALAEYKTITKYVSSFGNTLIEKAKLTRDGRIHASFNIGAARTLRFSSSGPNLQQIPRDKESFFGDVMSIRQSFVAGLGRRIIALDYSGIELRVLALLSGDEQLLHDMVHGDVHARVADYMAGRPIDKTVAADREIRQSAKGVSFGTIYGSGAAGLAATLRKPLSEAQDLLNFWGNRYPKAFQLRYQIQDEAIRTRRIRMIDGGTIWMGRETDLPKCANYPVQRAAWSIMARAIRRTYDALQAQRARGQQKQTRMIGTIHDELLLEAATKDAQLAYDTLEECMVCGYLDVFPGAPMERLVEGGIGKTWADVK